MRDSESVASSAASLRERVCLHRVLIDYERNHGAQTCKRTCRRKTFHHFRHHPKHPNELASQHDPVLLPL